MLTPNSERANIFFGTTGTNGNKEASIQYAHEAVSTVNDRRCLIFKNGGDNERMRIDSAGTIFSFSPDDTTPNIKFRSDDTNWFGSLNQSVHGATISTFLSTGGDWSANGTTYSATKAIAGFETRAIVLHPQFNNGAGKVAFLQKASGSTTTDGAVTEILKIDNDGIKFGSDTAADNALDDYEEGSFTPGSNATLTTAAGFYTKIGRQVTLHIRVTVASQSGTDPFEVNNFPFTAGMSGTTSNGAVPNGFGYISSGSVIPQIHHIHNGTKAQFYNFNNFMTIGNVSGKEYRFGLIYYTA